MNATGFQLLFLYFAGAFGAMLVSREVATHLDLPSHYFGALSQAVTMTMAGAILVLVPMLRRQSAELLAPPLDRRDWTEIAAAFFLKLAVPFGIVGACVLAALMTDSERPLAGISISEEPSKHWAYSLQPWVVIHAIAISWLVGPFVEEIYFRGFLYRAWQRQWGWLASTVLTSIAFAFSHPNHMFASFVASLIFVCLIRRTGSLRASIVVHCVTNALIWWPILGHILFEPRSGSPLAWTTWSLEIASFFVLAIGLPTYLLLARRPRDAETGHA